MYQWKKPPNAVGTEEENWKRVNALILLAPQGTLSMSEMYWLKIAFQTGKKPPSSVSRKLKRKTGIVVCAQLYSVGRYIR